MDFSYLVASEIGEDSRGKNTRWQVILRKNNQKQIIIVRDAVRGCFLANIVTFEIGLSNFIAYNQGDIC